MHADDGADFLRQVLPKKTECNFYVYPHGEVGLAINNYHHDSCTGREWYYAAPYDPDEEEDEKGFSGQVLFLDQRSEAEECDDDVIE